MEVETVLVKAATEDRCSSDVAKSRVLNNFVDDFHSSDDEKTKKPSRLHRQRKISSDSESEKKDCEKETEVERLENNFKNSSSKDNGDSTSSPMRNKPNIEKITDDTDSDSIEEINTRKIRVNSKTSNIIVLDNTSVTFPVVNSRKDSGDSCSPPIISKSRIRKISEDSESDSNNYPEPVESARIKGKRNKLQQKFKNLLSAKEKADSTSNTKSNSKSSSDDEAATIEKIKKKIKERTIHLKSTIYDPDTSDEENSLPKYVPQLKKNRNSIKLTSPKPPRMSAKQAMENMQKIKSESNRMLREKEVSLPYHRPKALSLKDIMSRRRPALAANGKALPIKMNEEQLKEYALMLEQRQKEMIELCKSESEEEAEDENDINSEDKNLKIKSDLNTNEKNDSNSQKDKNLQIKSDLENTELIESKNDSMFDDVADFQNKTTSLQEVNALNSDIVDDSIKNENQNTNINGNEDNLELMSKNDCSNVECNKVEYVSNSNSAKENWSIEVETRNLEGSAEMELLYNDSVENKQVPETNKETNRSVSVPDKVTEHNSVNTEVDSQLISLHFDSEKADTEKLDQIECITRDDLISEDTAKNDQSNIEETTNADESGQIANDFSDDDFNLEDIDEMIENVEILSQNKTENTFSPMQIKSQPLEAKPKLTGAPGMVIDLDGTDPFAPKKTGVELLKERFTYFSRLKTPEEIEREGEKRIKPGLQHFKLKQQLQEEIAEQRSLEWAKRLEEEKEQHKETEALIGNGSDVEDDIDKIDAKLDEMEVEGEGEGEEEPSSESEEEEEMADEVEKPRKRNPLIADEAEESECDDVDDKEEVKQDHEDTNKEEVNENDANNEEDEEDDESEESSDGESEVEDEQMKPKKGRILRAFEDSDDEELPVKENDENKGAEDEEIIEKTEAQCSGDLEEQALKNVDDNEVIKDTQDEEIQPAQRHKSYSDDLFTSQESTALEDRQNVDSCNDDKVEGTQTFSILNSGTVVTSQVDVPVPDNLFDGDTPSHEEGSLDHVVGMCSGSFSQSLAISQFPETQISLDIGEDVLAMCTGKFYDNQFVSQLDNGDLPDSVVKNNDSIDSDNLPKENNEYIYDTNRHTYSEDTSKNISQNLENVNETECLKDRQDSLFNTKKEMISEKADTIRKSDDNILLKSILDELHDPAFDTQTPMKYFGDDNENKKNDVDRNTSQKKRFVIESDDEDGSKETGNKKKKLKKKRMEKRALQISDDEEDEHMEGDSEVEDTSDIEHEDNEERIVEYDSEENEVIINPEIKKKKRKVADFFEQEAELTSEDEWVGSGDEDERGLDRMEREEGDDEHFNQKKLQRELEQIHMRDVLDQDKREVRMIQELLFEDGDLGGGGRQRKFRWRNADEGDENDHAYEFTDTQEEEFESEEQWRKQRHEREMFLKQLKQEDEDETLNISVNRTSLIKANLTSKGSLSSMIIELNESKTAEIVEKTNPSVLEKKTSKDIPSPEKPFAMFQPNMHNSLLSRGRGALARLAALAMPLAGDDDAPKVGSLAPSSKRNFVFTSITPDEEITKVTMKRKAETSVGTPRLVKKMKTEEKINHPRSSLLEHLKS